MLPDANPSQKYDVCFKIPTCWYRQFKISHLVKESNAKDDKCIEDGILHLEIILLELPFVVTLEVVVYPWLYSTRHCLCFALGITGDSKWSQFCHLVLYGESLYVVLPTSVQKSGVLDFNIGIIKKVIHFNGESPSLCNMM